MYKTVCEKQDLLILKMDFLPPPVLENVTPSGNTRFVNQTIRTTTFSFSSDNINPVISPTVSVTIPRLVYIILLVFSYEIF